MTFAADLLGRPPVRKPFEPDVPEENYHFDGKVRGDRLVVRVRRITSARVSGDGVEASVSLPLPPWIGGE
jgi:hypothetical protein